MREKKKPKMIRDKTVNDEQNETGNIKGKSAGGKKDLHGDVQNIKRGFKTSGRESSRNNSRQTRNK